MEKIGHNAPRYTAYTGKKRDGKWTKYAPKKDWILTRILVLEGLEQGKNRGIHGTTCVDSYKRCIYIHGTDAEHLLGQAVSHGCIRMANCDIELLERLVPIGTVVNIR